MASSFALFRFHSPLPTAPFLSAYASLLPPRRRPSRLPLFYTLSSPTVALERPIPSFPYGPSLRKGSRRPPSPGGDDGDGYDHPEVVDRDGFTRVFDLAALRVPAGRCAALEGRLRGHLLNWPRIRNVARVPGDEVDPEIAAILREGGGVEDRLGSVLQRARGDPGGEAVAEEALSPVLYREKLVKEFNCRGFVKFRSLAKMSRPKKKKKEKKEEKKEEEEGVEVKSRRGKDGFSVVEMVGDSGDEGREEAKEEDWSRLLGEDFARGRWTGPTRLLLLDERYANKGVEDLPEAVKVA